MSHLEFLGYQTADAVEFRIAPVVRGHFGNKRFRNRGCG